MTVQQIIQVTVVVEDYDEAIRFYTEKLNFLPIFTAIFGT